MYRNRNRPVSLALVGLFVWLTACSSYTQIEPSEIADHGKLRVTLTNGERETVVDARIEADTIKGRSKQGVHRPEWVELAISLDQVAELEAIRANAGGTVLVVLGSGLIVLTLVAAAVTASECSQGGMLC